MAGLCAQDVRDAAHERGMTKTANDPMTFAHRDVEAAYNGDSAAPYIDIDLHEDSRSESESSVAARITLTPEEAVALAVGLLREVGKFDLAYLPGALRGTIGLSL